MFTAMKQDGDNKVNFGYDHVAQIIKAGALMKDGDWTHAYEARWVFKEKAKAGAFGVPLHLATGGKIAYGKAHTLNYSMELIERVHAQMKWQHKVDSNWTTTVHQSFDTNKRDSAEGCYKLGFDVTYTI